MKVLHMTLKKKWFDMILRGEKKEECREIKPYWISRLVDALDDSEKGKYCSFFWKVGWWTMSTPIHYDFVEFKNGYSKDSPKFQIEILNIETGRAKSEWSDSLNTDVFIIKLGNIIKANTD